MARDRFEVVVPGSPEQVRRRLERGLLPVRSLWFPTLAELRAWGHATSPLFVRAVGRRIEVGPRVNSLQAARFCPVLLASLEPQGEHATRVAGEVRFPRFAAGLLAAWAVVLVVWLGLGTVSSLGGEPVGAWLIWWVVLAAALGLSGGLGGRLGGQALREALPELARVARDDAAGGDDW